jgi:hypothetical protein
MATASANPVVVDTRNCLDNPTGFTHIRLGRPA